MNLIFKLTAILIIFATLLTLTACKTPLLDEAGSDTAGGTLAPSSTPSTQSGTSTATDATKKETTNNLLSTTKTELET